MTGADWQSNTTWHKILFVGWVSITIHLSQKYLKDFIIRCYISMEHYIRLNYNRYSKTDTFRLRIHDQAEWHHNAEKGEGKCLLNLRDKRFPYNPTYASDNIFWVTLFYQDQIVICLCFHIFQQIQDGRHPRLTIDTSLILILLNLIFFFIFFRFNSWL